MEAIKKFILFSTQSSLKERNELFGEVFDVLRKIECQATTSPGVGNGTTATTTVEIADAQKAEGATESAEPQKDESEF